MLFPREISSPLEGLGRRYQRDEAEFLKMKPRKYVEKYPGESLSETLLDTKRALRKTV